MNPWQRMVNIFHRETGGTVGQTIAIRDRELRAKLIMEEAVETVAALGFAVSAEIYEPKGPFNFDKANLLAEFDKTYREPDLLDYIDGMCDLIYVVCGSAVAAGVDLDYHYSEVHRANMAKLDGPKREDGKQLKPEGWKGPDHQKYLDLQRAREVEWRARNEGDADYNRQLVEWHPNGSRERTPA